MGDHWLGKSETRVRFPSTPPTVAATDEDLHEKQKAPCRRCRFLKEVKYELAKRRLEDLIKINEGFHNDVSRWKLHYGLRQIGSTEDGKRVISGLDVFKYTTSQGIDLELLLLFFDQHRCVVDWVGYCKTATVECWMMPTILRKISYPITEVYGERYWNECKSRIMIWFMMYMETQK